MWNWWGCFRMMVKDLLKLCRKLFLLCIVGLIFVCFWIEVFVIVCVCLLYMMKVWIVGVVVFLGWLWGVMFCGFSWIGVWLLLCCLGDCLDVWVGLGGWYVVWGFWCWLLLYWRMYLFVDVGGLGGWVCWYSFFGVGWCWFFWWLFLLFWLVCFWLVWLVVCGWLCLGCCFWFCVGCCGCVCWWWLVFWFLVVWWMCWWYWCGGWSCIVRLVLSWLLCWSVWLVCFCWCSSFLGGWGWIGVGLMLIVVC